jgi:5'-3' exonuclease
LKENIEDEVLEDMIIDKTIHTILNYFDLIAPTQTFYVAFDGVAPFAKMEQQRTRRYKSVALSKLTPVNDTPRYVTWSTSNITPGTSFMKKLSDKAKQILHILQHRVETVIISPSDEVGEGEHKMFHYMRGQKRSPNDLAMVYGLDSDLIMLSIFHCRLFENIYIFRETPEFLKSSIPIQTSSNDANKSFHFMDVKKLSDGILNEMQCVHDQHRVFDYVFLCFFLGNDFLPHFPCLNLRTNGMNVLLENYKKCIGKYPNQFLISKTMEIDWKQVSILVTQLARLEHDLLLSEYDLREKWSNRKWNTGTVEEKDFTFQSVPVIYRQEEEYINPSAPYWNKRYYDVFFGETVGISNICLNYMEGLEWVFRYYTQCCPDWKWRYRYHYPPLLQDLVHSIPIVSHTFVVPNAKTNTPFHPVVQLSYVLPKANHCLLPTAVQNVLIRDYSSYFPDTYDFQWAFCRYFWEAHIKLKTIPLEVLMEWETKLVNCCA